MEKCLSKKRMGTLPLPRTLATFTFLGMNPLVGCSVLELREVKRAITPEIWCVEWRGGKK